MKPTQTIQTIETVTIPGIRIAAAIALAEDQARAARLQALANSSRRNRSAVWFGVVALGALASLFSSLS